MSKVKTTASTPTLRDGQTVLLGFPEKNLTYAAMSLLLCDLMIEMNEGYRKTVLHALEHDVVPAGRNFIEAVITFPVDMCQHMLSQRFEVLTSRSGIKVISVDPSTVAA